MDAFSFINSFFYFSMNYNINHYDWTDMWGEQHSDYLPDFVMGADWGCSREHMIKKWKQAEQEETVNGRMNYFYSKLDNKNRRALIDWMMENYHE
jgi:hypothetical protein